MGRLVRHVLLPLVPSLGVVGLYFTPVAWIGCTTRGYVALAIVLVSLLAGIAMALQGLRLKSRGEASYAWWVLSAALLVVPALLVLGPLG